MDLISLEFRVLLMAGFSVIALLQAGTLVYFWKKLTLWQRAYALAFVLVQIYVIDALREFEVYGVGFEWRLVPLSLALLLLIGHSFVPYRRRKKETQVLNTTVFLPKD